MDELLKCTTDNECPSESLFLESMDVLAYNLWLVTEAFQAPFATLVILHNLVSDSVNDFFVRGGHKRFFCVRDVASALKGLMPNDFVPNVPESLQGRLPGIGKHRLIDCTEKEALVVV